MKVLNFKKVASSANDAAVEYFVPADRILAMVSSSSNGLVTLYLKAVAGTDNDAKGDKISITCAGAAESTADLISEMLYGNRFSKGGANPVIDASFNGGAISQLQLDAVS